MPSKRGKRQTHGRNKPTDIIINEPQCYDCPEGHAHIYIFGKRYRIPVLLDSGSNIFLINEQLVKDLHIPYHSRLMQCKSKASLEKQSLPVDHT